MFREPDEEPTNTAAARVDKTAATLRSTIRRESTIRPNRYNTIPSPRPRPTPSERGALLIDYRRHRQDAPRDPTGESERFRRRLIEAQVDDGERQMQRRRQAYVDAVQRDDLQREQPFLEAENERHRRSDELMIARERTRRARDARSRIRWGSLNDYDAADSERREAGEELLRDALQHNRPGQRLRLPRPPRESALRFEVAPSPPASDSSRPTSPRERTLTRPYIPSLSPPRALTDPRARHAVPDGPLPSTDDSALTPGFAPAQAAYQASDRDFSPRPVPFPTTNASDDELPDLETPPADTWESSYPPLRRVGHLSPRPASARYDGLGDRQRSPSIPVSDSSVEEDTWETLLTTMEEDQTQPSADSSFTSAIASASTSRRSDSASRSGRSSQTAATSVDGPDALDSTQPCDLDDLESTGRTVPLAEVIRRTRAREDRDEATRYPSLREQRRVIERMHELARENISSAERRTAAAEDRLRRIEHRAEEAEAELAHMQRLIDRLSRREQIPSDWWAAAGLSGTLREHERHEQREQERAEEERLDETLVAQIEES